MDPEFFSTKWFALYYAVFGVLVLLGGCYLLIRYKQVRSYLVEQSNYDQPPTLFRRILKYWLLFTLPGLVLSFFPFSWIELLFSVWSLVMIYLAGIQLVRWEQTGKIIQTKRDRLEPFIRFWGVMMVAVALVIFLLDYLVIRQTSAV